MKTLKKCFSVAGDRKSRLSFATFVICGIILLAVPLQISCSDSGDDSGDSIVEGGADADRNNSDGSVKTALEEGVTSANVDKLMIAVPGKNFSILATEVTQELYESVMGENPSSFKGEKNLPVETVSWYDAVYFCNKLSEKCGLASVYDVDGETDVEKWSYAPHKGNIITGTVSQNENANGYRLPTVEEWQYAAKGGQEFTYSGSYNSDEVGWYNGNSEEKTHPVAQKDPNGYGLYDMSGNVREWCWDSNSSKTRYICGGSWSSSATGCEVGDRDYGDADNTYITSSDLGFRIVRSSSKK